MKKILILSMSHSTMQVVVPATAVEEIILLDLSTAPHLHVANANVLSLIEAVVPSVNHFLDDLTVLGMSVIVLVDGMTEEEEDAVVMRVFENLSLV